MYQTNATPPPPPQNQRPQRAKTGVVWLIDAAYVLSGHQGNIDYTDVRRRLQEWAIPGVVGGRFDQIIFYNSYVPDGRADKFHDELRRRGFQIKLYPLKKSNYTCEGCGYAGKKIVQRGVDIAICTDLLRLAYEGHFKRVVLTAGDGDFLDAVKLVRARFQEVYLSGYRNSMSADMEREVDAMHWLQ